METNPYAAPQAESQVDPISLTALGELVKGWEKLRLIYNIILFLPGASVMAYCVVRDGMDAAEAAFMLAIVSGIIANLAFFLGPLGELYLRVLCYEGKETPVVRRFLFFLGLLVSLAAMLMISVRFLF